MRCGHGRTGTEARRCPLCAERVSPADYWEMRRWLNELRRKGKRHAA